MIAAEDGLGCFRQPRDFRRQALAKQAFLTPTPPEILDIFSLYDVIEPISQMPAREKGLTSPASSPSLSDCAIVHLQYNGQRNAVRRR